MKSDFSFGRFGFIRGVEKILDLGKDLNNRGFMYVKPIGQLLFKDGQFLRQVRRTSFIASGRRLRKANFGYSHNRLFSQA